MVETSNETLNRNITGNGQKIADLTPKIQPRSQEKKSRKPRGSEAAKIGSILFFFCMGFVIYAGWKIRERQYFTAEEGAGYILGIVGASLMLLLMVYPLRKRFRTLEFLGGIKFWFRFHMILGVLGPVCVLFHANFQLGSLNSNVALICMLVVSASGLAGRYLYTRIHYGLYGQRATLEELRNNYQNRKEEMGGVLDFAPAVSEKLLHFSDSALAPHRGALNSLLHLVLVGFKTRYTYWKLCAGLKQELKNRADSLGWNRTLRRHIGWKMKKDIWNFLKHVRKTAEFRFYERVFSLWHVLHFPLFLMLLLSGIFHVFAVHAY